jgi:hypothetical protein
MYNPFGKPLFLPLNAEFYWAFLQGEKSFEYRAYGPRWNEWTCATGRQIILSCGYGKKHRTMGIIKAFTKIDRENVPYSPIPFKLKPGQKVACILIRLEGEKNDV